MGCNSYRILTSRRQMLFETAGGVGGLALAYLLGRDGLLSTAHAAEASHTPRKDRAYDLKSRPPERPATARAMISLFMHGGPSHMDLFDPKPELTRHDGEEYQGDITFSFVNRASKTLMASPFKFEKHG